jgi:hypothetical protein
MAREHQHHASGGSRGPAGRALRRRVSAPAPRRRRAPPPAPAWRRSRPRCSGIVAGRHGVQRLFRVLQGLPRLVEAPPPRATRLSQNHQRAHRATPPGTGCPSRTCSRSSATRRRQIPTYARTPGSATRRFLISTPGRWATCSWRQPSSSWAGPNISGTVPPLPQPGKAVARRITGEECECGSARTMPSPGRPACVDLQGDSMPPAIAGGHAVAHANRLGQYANI